MNTNYHFAIIFTKHTDLIPWFEAKYHDAPDSYNRSVGFNQFKDSYSKLRDVQLILLVRYEYPKDGSHIYCKIKCPINPLPIKGEFEVASLKQLIKLLEREGWAVKNKLPISLLK